ncbi:ABC transporter ATP-binding protein [bacterium]|nr:ABC transporter ATP-binding protein [bacterium]
MEAKIEKVIELKDLKTYFFTKKGIVKAVDGISFSIDHGEIVGLIGESGSGKSITSLSILRLVPQPTGKTIGGEILFHGENLLDKREDQMKKLRGDKISMTLGNPIVSLNQILSVEFQISEMFKRHSRTIIGSLKDVCLNVLNGFRIKDDPFKLSRDIKQKAIIGLGVSNNPDLLIADEPTTDLDETAKTQVLELMERFQKQTNAAILMITADLPAAEQICSRILVMYAGKIVEKASVKAFYQSPKHPYSIGLINSAPKLEKKGDQLNSTEGQLQDILDPHVGCRFASKCEKVKTICTENHPPEITLEDDHRVSCWLYAEQFPAS